LAAKRQSEPFIASEIRKFVPGAALEVIVRHATYITITMAFPAVPSPQRQQRRSLPCRAGTLLTLGLVIARAVTTLG